MKNSERKLRESDITLSERGKVYGGYDEGLTIREDILEAISKGYAAHHGSIMPKRQLSYFFDIANKLSRLAISPDHADSWHDICGYSKLIENSVKKEEGADNEDF